MVVGINFTINIFCLIFVDICVIQCQILNECHESMCFTDLYLEAQLMNKIHCVT